MTSDGEAPRVNPRLIRSYDLRGVVGRDLTEADALGWGRRVAEAAGAGARVAVGYDGRLSSPALAAALSDGLRTGGARVTAIGLGPTGMLYHAVHHHGCTAGVMVTGSHNPPDQNGFKTVIGGEPVFGPALKLLADRRGEAAAGGTIEQRDVSADYIARLAAAASGCAGLRIGWDPGNGATGAILAQLTARLPGEHRIINGRIDGTFPAHHPDPSVPANLAHLSALVADEQLDLGIAFDGDGDRIGVVDGAEDGGGEILWPDQLILLLAEDALRDHPGAPIVADVKSSRVLFDGIAAAGGRAVLSPSGYVLVRDAMRRERAPLAGEMSGHIFYADRWDGTDDALHVAMRLLAALGRREESVAAFRRALPPTFATPELRLPCPDGAKAAILATVERALGDVGIERIDGLRVTEPDGWWLLRASGTEPALTARIEAWTADGLERLRDALFARLRDAGWSDPQAPSSATASR